MTPRSDAALGRVGARCWASLLGLLALLGAPSGCARAPAPYPPAPRPPVVRAGAVVFTTELPRGERVGPPIVVAGNRPLPALVDDFAARVAQLGGTVAYLQSIELQRVRESRVESNLALCGVFPRNHTCYRSHDRELDVVVTTLRGGAYR